VSAYYNEFDRQKAAWLRELISRDLIAPGDVDERSIHDVRPDDLRRYTQCHWFAGVGIWSYALRIAGWPDDRECWTGSCPCPSFSCAGKGEGFDDPRHLWPVWMPLFRERRPPVCFGEQADGAIGHGWLDLVSTDLEAENYAVAAAVLGACSVGAPHRRQRLYWVADCGMGNTAGEGLQVRAGEAIPGGEARGFDQRSGDAGLLDDSAEARRTGERIGGSDREARDEARLRELAGRGSSCVLVHTESLGRIGRTDDADAGRGECSPGHRSEAGELGHAETARLQARVGHSDQRGTDGGTCAGSEQAGGTCGLADTDGRDAGAEGLQRGREHGQFQAHRGPLNGFWSDAEWIYCRDGKYRPAQRIPFEVADGTADLLGLVRDSRGGYVFPLQKGGKARVMRLRGYGDGIVAQVAAEFIRAYMDTTL
jgi:DNA (cytosine-5)-methyltransferase 1